MPITPSRPEKGSLHTLSILRLGSHGEGIGSIDGYTTFVEGALPGEEVQVEITVSKKTFLRAQLKEILRTSPERSQPPCGYFSRCGGCQIMHLSEKGQLGMKRQNVTDALERIGGVTHPTVHPCSPSSPSLAYRNKIQLPVGGKAGCLEIGLYARGTHQLIPVESCAIHCPLGEKALKAVREALEASSLTPYSAQTQKGELRHLLIRSAVETGEVLIIFVTNGPASAELRRVSEKLLQTLPEIKGVVENINERRDNVILGSRFRTLAGQESIEDCLNGLRFRVSPASFFQVNPWQAQQLYKKVLEVAQIQEGHKVLDLYCGVGTLTLHLAQEAQEVLGIEVVSQAVQDAYENAKVNGIENVRFLCGDAASLIHQTQEVDVAIVNPPRKGCAAEVLHALVEREVQRIIYVSCDPATLSRDVQLLTKKGYEFKEAYPFDMFPQTSHVETVAVIERVL